MNMEVEPVARCLAQEHLQQRIRRELRRSSPQPAQRRGRTRLQRSGRPQAHLHCHGVAVVRRAGQDR